MQVVTRALEAALPGAATARSAAATAPVLRERIVSASSLLLRERTATFTECLLSFLQSRGSIEAWDQRFATALSSARSKTPPRSDKGEQAAPASTEQSADAAPMHTAGARRECHTSVACEDELNAAKQPIRACGASCTQRERSGPSSTLLTQGHRREGGSIDRCAQVLSTSEEGHSDGETDEDAVW